MKDIRILSVITGYTLLCAAFNSWEEQLPSVAFYFGTIIAAVGTSLFSIFLLVLLRNGAQFTRGVFTVFAYVVCLTGAIAYSFFAINGKADTINSAANMHVVVFPITHAFFTLTLGFGVTLCAFVVFLYRKIRNVQSAAGGGGIPPPQL